jgi:hypothetical protein
MSGYLTTPWSEFSVAVVGASAALTGLLFVAVSINIEQILAIGALAGRALSTMLLFVIPLVVGILVLVPGQSLTALGLELIVTGVIAGGGLGAESVENPSATADDVQNPAMWQQTAAAEYATPCAGRARMQR